MTVRDIDREVLERLEACGNSLGWKPHHRTKDGDAVMVADVPMNGYTRRLWMKITPKGILYDEATVLGDGSRQA